MSFFGFVIISDLYLFKVTVLLNPCYVFQNISKQFDVIINRQNNSQNIKQALFIKNFAPVVVATGFGLAPTFAAVLDISVIMQCFDHNKSNSIS